MLFHSFVFLLLFAPVAVAGYHLIARSRFEPLRLPFLILVSLVFYGYWAPEYTVLLLASVAANYGLGRLIAARPPGPWRRALVAGGVVGNLAALGYFKYAVFVVDNLAAALGTGWQIEAVLLPLAISFYTFQQIAFLVDVGRGQVQPGGPVAYTAFVIFFPQLIAGPIVHYRELAPQLSQAPARDRLGADMLVGITIFAIGLVKKTVLADSFALYASPVFDAAAGGVAPGTLAAWGAALAVTLQIYFDFSGYSDMAIGLARMFGVALPLNFHAPLRARSIAELWRRWHMTLSRFVQAYVFQPLALPMTRLAARGGLGKWGTLALSALLPAFVSMLVIGFWHGAGWTFVLFGAMHGSYIVIGEIWHAATRRRRRRGQPAPPPPSPLRAALTGAGFQLLTVAAFAVAQVPFRAADMGTVGLFFAAMAGFGDGAAALPADWPGGGAGALGAVLGGLALVWVLPATQQVMARAAPALDWPAWAKVAPPVLRLTWRPTPAWAFATGALLLLGMAFILRGSTEFIYFNF